MNQNFQNKRSFLTTKLRSQYGQTLNISINRNKIFSDSYKLLYYRTPNEIKYGIIKTTFVDEVGQDQGGLTREWFQVITKEMFNPDYLLFKHVCGGTLLHPNRISGYVNENHLSHFKFIGRIIGKAIYENIWINCCFTNAVYKKLIGVELTLEDMKSFDMDYFRSLSWILNNEISSNDTTVASNNFIVDTFSIQIEDFGTLSTIDLIPNGSLTIVTEENKKEYVKAVIDYHLYTSIKDQMDNLILGIHEIIPKEYFLPFTVSELQLLISGPTTVDINIWKENTIYDCCSEATVEIKWFWQALESFGTQSRLLVLQFSTGLSKPLLGWVSKYDNEVNNGINTQLRFTIHLTGNKNILPSAHTCNNQLDLPIYDSYELLRKFLLLAITEGHEGFSFY